MMTWNNRNNVKPSRVLSNLYLGRIGDASNRSFIEENRITHVLTICPVRPIHFPGIEYKTVGVNDTPNVRIINKFEECCEWIEAVFSRGGVVLVHCFAGISRSATIVIAFLMKLQKISYREAFTYLKGRRRVIQPNFGFLRQLEEYDKYLKSLCS